MFDADLQSMVADFQTAAGDAITAQTQERAFDEVNHLTRLAHQVNSRIGELLPELV